MQTIKHNIAAGLLAIITLVSAPAQASVTYTHTGLAFTQYDSWLYSNYNLLGDRNIFSFSFANALGANLSNQSVSALVTDWYATVKDTPKTKIGSAVTDSNSKINTFSVSTDATGKITNWSINVTGFTNDIYPNVLNMEVLSESPGTDAIGIYNPLGYPATWPYRGGAIPGVTGDNYGLAYCMGFSCTAGNEPAWQVSVSSVPEPESYAMLVAGLGLLGGVARRKSKQL
jgi:hypothetical protein